MQTKAKPRRVDFFDNDNDMEVLLMGELGLSSKAIAEATGLTT